LFYISTKKFKLSRGKKKNVKVPKKEHFPVKHGELKCPEPSLNGGETNQISPLRNGKPLLMDLKLRRAGQEYPRVRKISKGLKFPGGP